LQGFGLHKRKFSFSECGLDSLFQDMRLEDCVVGGPVLYSNATVQKQCYIH